MQTQYSTYRTLLAPVSGHGLSEAEAKDILRQILPHLCEMHDRQQSHGSISLDTVAYDYSRMEIILLSENGTTSNPIYLAPEVLQTQQATPTGDIYALGVVIIVLLTGFPPQALKTQNDTWNWQQLCNVSDQFMQILNIALAAEPDLRYDNAGQMLKSLQPIINPSEPTLTSLASDYGTFLLSPKFLKVLSSKQSSPVPLSPESSSSQSSNSEQSDSESSYSHKTKKLKVNFSNTQVYRKANDSKNQPQEVTKDITRKFLTLILGVGVIVSSALGAYFYARSKSADIEKKNLELANVVDQLKDKETLRINEIARTDEEKNADDVDKLISLAKAKYENAGDLIESKTMLQAIPLDSRMRSKADQLLAQWELDIKKNSALIKKAEKAAKDEKWQIAIDTVKGISPTPYWQLRGKEIVEEAKQKLATTTVVTPSSQSVISPLPNVDTPRAMSTETYNPPAETYTPPAETYTPPTEKASPPLPPAPRVAQ